MTRSIEEEAKATVLRAFEEITNRGNMAVAPELFTADFQRHDLGALFPDVVGPGGVKNLIGALRAAMPDIRAELNDFVAEGDRVAVRYTMSGTHTGELLGFQGTGRRVTFAGMNIYRLVDGKLAESWQLLDSLGLLRQIGAVP
jgi:steroid delta-isomerase-like uncharacterized protein